MRIEVKVEQEGSKIGLVFLKKTHDLTIYWRDAFKLGNALGEIADAMPECPSDPGQDEAEADYIRVGFFGETQIIIFVRDGADRLFWNRNAALIVAEKICAAAQKVAEKLVAKQKRI